MCGIAAMLALNGSAVEASRLERMTSIIAHRGPDDAGFHYSGAVGLGFRRLSILDLTPAGHQPMSIADGQVTIIFNGEIYNFVELRSELQGLGHVFRSTGDTEVLLHAYLQWGKDCLSKLNGMWAFVIHDARTGTLFGARDRFGIKPLFRFRGRDHVLFASEIKAILASGLCSPAVNSSVAASYLTDGRLDESEATFYAGIMQVPPAFAFELRSSGQYKQWRYWDILDSRSVDLDEPAKGFAELFEDAVRLHMRSDVPVGIHLSGGLDSTAIACASARVRKETGASGALSVFSYMAPEFDESEYIRATVALTGAHLIELETSPEQLWADLQRMLWFQDEPVHTLTALVGFQLMRATATHGIKVVLNGQGADETLAGYPNYFRNYWAGVARSSGLREVWREVKANAGVHDGASPARLVGQLLLRRSFDLLWTIGPYRALSVRRRNARARDGWFTPDLLRELPDSYPASPTDLRGALAYSQAVAPLPLYLRLEDRNAMAHSIEARLPFLDYRLAEFAFSLPDHWKMRGPWNKFILRQAMAGRIPENVRMRADKMGFPVPARKWFAGQLFEPVIDLLTSRNAVQSGRYRMEVVRRDIERHRRGEADFTDELFAVAQFELWSEGLDKARTNHPQNDGAQAQTAVTSDSSP
jgi:asparagine synthase (glutamine-hydrolysing)